MSARDQDLRQTEEGQGIDLAQARAQTEALAARVETLAGSARRGKGLARENAGDVGGGLGQQGDGEAPRVARRRGKN